MKKKELLQDYCKNVKIARIVEDTRDLACKRHVKSFVKTRFYKNGFAEACKFTKNSPFKGSMSTFL